MAEFCNDYLAARKDEPLTIVDLGSCDYNGSSSYFRRNHGVETWRRPRPGKNVDLVLREAYHWREYVGGVDVLVSGQTLEHTGVLLGNHR
jgi:hypothetical protein